MGRIRVRCSPRPLDLGAVLAHNTKTDLHRCDVLQPEVVPLN